MDQVPGVLRVAGQARAASTDAARTYAALGATWDLRRLDARLRTHGVRRGSRSLQQRPSNGWTSFSPGDHPRVGGTRLSVA